MTQLTHSMALVLFTFAVNFVEAKVFPDANFNPLCAGRISPSAVFLSCIFMSSLKNCSDARRAAVPFSAFFVPSILDYIKF